MSETYGLTIYGLLRKPADMAGETDAIRHRLSVALSDLDHIDAVIRMLKPDIGLDYLPTRQVPSPSRASRGEVQRHVFDILRGSPTPLTTRELARTIMERRRMNADDRALYMLVLRRTEHNLSRLRKAGTVQSDRASSGALLRWRTA